KKTIDILQKERRKAQLVRNPLRFQGLKDSLLRIDHALIYGFEKKRIKEKPCVHKPAVGAFNNRERLIASYAKNSIKITAVSRVQLTKAVCRELDQKLRSTLTTNRTV